MEKASINLSGTELFDRDTLLYIIYGMGCFSIQDTYVELMLCFKYKVLNISANLEEAKFAHHN